MKSQVNQIFLYIMAIVIFGLILVYGGKEVIELINRGKTVSYMQFRIILEREISGSKSYGNVDVVKFVVPDGVEDVCIIDIGESADDSIGHKVVYDSWSSRVKSNVFLLPVTEQNEPFMLEDIEVIDNNNKRYVCIKPSQGRINLRLEGTGKKVKVSEG